MPSYEFMKTPVALRVADTEYGRVRGAAGNNPKFTVFKGIPYAKAPIGDLRWRMAEPHDAWEGVRDCVEFGPASFQFMGHMPDMEESEDCLYLNIFTPAGSPDAKLPVLFFIPGGAFMGGASNRPQYDGEGFCKRGVILVTINYRTGPLGMLSHRDMLKENPYGVCGNIYYLDQIFALKWVRRNIANFGGDPDKITIMGHSSGAVAVTALSCSPLTEGDIFGTIIESGPVTHDLMDPDDGAHSSPFWIDKEEALRRGDQFMEAAGCSSLDELRKLSCEELGDVYKKMPGWLCFFRGVIDGYTFPEDPCDLYIKGKHHNVHYMIGQAGDEGSQIGPFTSVLTRENVDTYAKKFEECADDFRNFTEKLSDAELATGLVDGNAYRCRMFAETQLANGMKPAYYFCTIRRAPGDDAGAYHGIEHAYVFQTLDRDWRFYTGSDYDLSNQMAEYWANFCKTGNPNDSGKTDGPERPYALQEWRPYTSGDPVTMMFDTSSWMGERKLAKVQQYKLDYFMRKYGLKE